MLPSLPLYRQLGEAFSLESHIPHNRCLGLIDDHLNAQLLDLTTLQSCPLSLKFKSMSKNFHAR